MAEQLAIIPQPVIDILTTGVTLIITLGVLIFFHEAGHFVAAKLCGIRVEEFALGLGPLLARLFKHRETEYTVHLIPLGGFVRLAGMEPGQEDIPDGFQAKPVRKRMIVILAGPLMSLVLAYMVFSILGFAVGMPTGMILNKVDLVAPDSEAERIGLKTGDVIIAINGQRIDSGEEMIRMIHSSPGKPITLVVKRNGATSVLVGTPKPEKEDGRIVGRLGFIPAPVLRRVGLRESISNGTVTTVAFLASIISSLFSREVTENVGGPLAIADAAQTSVKRGLHGVLQLAAILSLSLAIVNLLPIPILDGGHIMLLIVEKVRGKRLSPKTVEMAHRVGFTIIAILFLFIMYLDLNRLAANKLFR